MLKELAAQLDKEIKEKVPGIDISAGQATSITLATLQVLGSHLRGRTLFNKAKFFDYTVDIVEGLLKEVPGGTE
jgi:hypothetical protein